jgi:predicted MPP superfamily phosphohydrolase
MFAYVGKRLISPLRLGRLQKWIVWFIFLLFPIFVPLSVILRMYMGYTSFGDVLGWIGYVGLGFFSLVFAFLLIRDGIWVLATGFKKVIAAAGRGLTSKSGQLDRFDPNRRHFLTQSMNIGILGASALLTGYGAFEARRQPSVVRVSIPSPRLPGEFEGFRIAQISDIHVGPTVKREYVETIVEQVNQIEPDAIVFTGDLADGRVADLREDVAPLKDLSAPFGKFFVTGNHEYYAGPEDWIEEVNRLGFEVLLNEHSILQRGSGRIVLAGVTDYHGGHFVENHTSDPGAAAAGTNRDDFRILLAHQPRSIFSVAEQGFDIQLSGHTHGGQYFYGNILIALSQPFLKGLHRHHNTWIYINSGTGYWGPPIRLGVPSEITIITLTASKRQIV